MKRVALYLAVAGFAGGVALSAPAFADTAPQEDAHAVERAHPDGQAHGDDHGAAKGAGHGAHGDEHAPTFHDVNWFYGFLGEKEGVEPSLLWRTPGMPVPFGALALNTAILYFLLFKFGRKPISDALKSRKLGIMKGMEDAAKMKAEAEARLAEYEEKLANIDKDVERIKREMKESGEAERAHILSEAKERRTRMERDARLLIEQELKAAREELLRDTVRAAVKSAEATLTARVGDADQQRLADEYLSAVKASGSTLRGRL